VVIADDQGLIRVGYTSGRAAMHGLHAGLRTDRRHSGIGVTHMVPAKVSSEQFLHNPGSEHRIPTIARLAPPTPPDQTAEAICRAVERGRRELIVPSMLRAFFSGERFMPREADWLAWRTGARRKVVPVSTESPTNRARPERCAQTTAKKQKTVTSNSLTVPAPSGITWGFNSPTALSELRIAISRDVPTCHLEPSLASRAEWPATRGDSKIGNSGTPMLA